jgi:hypothetical protein
METRFTRIEEIRYSEATCRLAVILEEGQPTFLGITATPDHSEIPSYASFGNDEAQLLEFAVNLGSTPARILFGQAANKSADFSSSFRFAT